jgi:glycosyltransferase involved in cell wall biosynthesis
MEISVITAVYNGERYLQTAIDSILRQTERSFEYIIVNDGSTDDTKKILEHIQDKRVKIIHQLKNLGAATCLRLAVEQAGGSWIAIQDADDISMPMRLEKQRAFLIEHPHIGLVGSFIQCISEPQLKRRAIATEHLINTVHSNPFYGASYCHGTLMFSKKLYKQIGGYSEKYKIAYDYDLLRRFRSVTSIAKVPERLYQYRIRNESLSNRKILETNKESMEISLLSIIDYTRNHPRDFLIIGTDAARCFFKKEMEPLLSRKCHYEAKNLENYHIIILDHKGSQKWINLLNKKGIPFFKIWCLFYE